MPIYLNAHLTVAEGIREGTEEEWDDLRSMYDSVASTIKFDKNGTRGEGAVRLRKLGDYLWWWW